MNAVILAIRLISDYNWRPEAMLIVKTDCLSINNIGLYHTRSYASTKADEEQLFCIDKIFCYLTQCGLYVCQVENFIAKKKYPDK